MKVKRHELQAYEACVAYLYKAMKEARDTLIKELDLMDIDFDWDHCKIVYIGEGPDDDFLGPRILTANSIEEIEKEWNGGR